MKAGRKYVDISGIRGNLVPLGVSSAGRDLIFAAEVPVNRRTGKRECSLLLYEKGETEPVAEFLMDPVPGQGDVCAAKVSGFTGANYEYNYKIEDKIVTDPYAQLIRGNELYGQVCRTIRGAICADGFDWGEDRNPAISYSELVLYKLHVRGFTKHPSSGVRKKGTFAGVAEKLPYLKELGINAVLLMPCTEYLETKTKKEELGHSAEFLTGYKELPDAELAEERFRRQQGEEQGTKVNYWGYGTDGWYFAPKASYAYNSADPVNELKRMIKQFHENGIEVWMEFWFASSVSGSLILDCLRYWAMQYHVDGFRLFGENVPYTLIALDPYLKAVKLLADGWDSKAYGGDGILGVKRLGVYAGEFSYHAKCFLRGEGGHTAEAAANAKRNPENCGIVNYITDHNGFTLNDLYSYEEKHNEANGENNRDGEDFNGSFNCGEEGPTRKKAVMKLRLRMVKNALLSLLTAQGTPMLYAGDEWLNSQAGNNNAYCQDNETGWVDWSRTKAKREIYEYTRKLIALRREHPILHSEKELTGMDRRKTGRPDISFHSTRAWVPDYANYSHALAILYNEEAIESGKNALYVIYNMHWETLKFDLPRPKEGYAWYLLVDPGVGADGKEEEHRMEEQCRVGGRTMLVLEERKVTDEEMFKQF